MRKLEERVGELIRAEREAGRLTTKGGDPESKVGIPTLEAVGISKQDAADFVAMAEHADVVEDVIANSDDANPPTRNKVMTAIKSKKQREVIEQAEKDLADEIEKRGLKVTTDPSELAEIKAREAALGAVLGIATAALSVKERYGTAGVACYSDDSLWPTIVDEVREAIAYLEQLAAIPPAKEAA